MAEPLTTMAAVTAALLRPLTANEATSIGALIDQASTRLRGRMPSIDTRIALWDPAVEPDAQAPTALNPDLVSSVLAGVIKRYMVNVEGAASKSRAAGPFSQTTSFASYGKAIGSEGKLQITDDDLAELEAATSSTLALPRTIKLKAPDAPYASCRPWVDC